MNSFFGKSGRSDKTVNILLHIAVPVTLCLLLVAFQFNMLEDDRQRHLLRAQGDAHDLGSTVASSIAGSFENIDLTLQAAVDHVELWNGSNLASNIPSPTLLKLQNRVPSVIELASSDANGNIVFYSKGDKAENLSVADRDYFRRLKNDPSAAMTISEPLMGHVSKRWVLICARRYNRPNGEFGGIVLASVELEGYLNRLSGGQIKLSGDDAFLLRDDASHAIIRYAKGRQDIGVTGNTVNSENLNRLGKAHAETGLYVSNSAVDNVERIYYYQRISGRAMNLVVGISVKDALNEWQAESKKTWLETGALVMVILIAGFLVYRSRQRQLLAFTEIQHIQIQLEQTNLELGRLSTTDGLTGLANRRKFDEVGPHEWSRAMRKCEPLAVAMVDVDFFKIYNDRYGHQAGDQCLTAIARVLATGLRDGSDFIARYGGEEFVILLPGQNVQGAFEVLDRLRADVEAMAIPHMGSAASSVITITAGFATVIPVAGISLDNLIEQADQSLYAAKSKGKNQVIGAQGSQTWSSNQRKLPVFGA